MKQSSEFVGIKAQLVKLGFDFPELARKLKIGVSVLSKLDQRLITLATIPIDVIESVANELKVSADILTKYLSGTPKLASGANYKSPGTPRVVPSRQVTFENALKGAVKSEEMSESDKAHWLDPKGGDPQ
jgi:hypothetical protein